MRSSLLGRVVVRFYPRLPLKSRLLRLAVAREGGEFTSLSLRSVLSDYYGVEVGPFSYGSLLQPGHSDRGLRLGSYISVGPGVRRFGANHPLGAPLMHPFAYEPSLGYVGRDADVVRTTCVIEDDAWIGANALILPGCRRIGRGAVVGAGAVVTRDVEDFAVVVGNPARQVRLRFDAERRTEISRWELGSRPPHEVVEEAQRMSSRWADRE